MDLLCWFKKNPLVWLWLAIVYLISGIIVNLIQLILLPLWVINRNLFRWINFHVVYLHWCQLTFLVEWWSCIDIKLYGRKEDYDILGKESAICLSNHRSDIDWLIGYVIADRAGVLSSSKCYMKGYLKFLPIIGFSWWCTEYAFVNRNWQKDKKVLDQSLQTLKDFPFPFWMAIFAEGTRLTEAKLKASVEHARSKGLPELKHHLLPRSRGFALTVQYFKDKVPAVYDMEVAFPSNTEPQLHQIIRGESCEAHFWLRRIPLSDIPCDTIEGASKWCLEAFEEKDKGMSYFVDHGRFPAERIEYPRKPRNLVIVIVWNILLCLPLMWYFVTVLMSGSITSFFIAGTILLIGYIMIRVLLHFTDSKKGSSFGLKTPGGASNDVQSNNIESVKKDS